MKKLGLIAALLGSGFLNAGASTAITSPTVSGHWTVTGSPYLIFNNIAIASGTSLVVDPGVEIIFQGFYQLHVSGGIMAAGTAAQPISFHVQDTTGWADTSVNGGWEGIIMGAYGAGCSDSSTFAYCNFMDMKRNGVYLYSTSILFSNCNFYHNNSALVGGTFSSGNNCEMASCTVHDNIANRQVMGFYYGSCNLHDCTMYNNNSGADMLYSWGTNFVFNHNEVYYNTQTDSSIASSLDFNRGSTLITANKIHHNTSAFDGVLCVFDGNSDINGNFVTNNSALTGFTGSSACGLVEGGGGIRVSSQDVGGPIMYQIRNNVIANNYAGLQGGGIDVFWASAIISNNTIVNNTSGFVGGGIYVFDDSVTSGNTYVTIRNNIFKNNVARSLGGSCNVFVDAGHCFTYDHNWTEYPYYEDVSNLGFGCDTLTVDSASNVIGTDPALIAPTLTNAVTEDATTANFGIDTFSTCINMGDTSGIFATAYDFAGNARIQGGRIDIGAYESHYWPHTTGMVTPYTTQQSLLVYPNPSAGAISVLLPQAKGTIEIVDATGRHIAAQKVTATLNTFDLRDAPRGLYFVTWKNGNSKATEQVVIE